MTNNPVEVFTQYRRAKIAEMRPFVEGETISDRVSISASDREAGSPKLGDMIARNPANHDDQWLVAADYFAENFTVLAHQIEALPTDPVEAEQEPAGDHIPAVSKMVPVGDWVLVPREITPEIGHALESNFADCLPPSEVHAANWREAWTKVIAISAAPVHPQEPVAWRVLYPDGGLFNLYPYKPDDIGPTLQLEPLYAAPVLHKGGEDRGASGAGLPAHAAFAAATEAPHFAGWLRAGNLLYTLEQIGWRKGEPVEQNRLMVRIDGGPNATAEELDGLATRLLALLSSAKPADREGSRDAPKPPPTNGGES